MLQIKKKIVIYGNEWQRKNLQYVFDELIFEICTEDETEVIQYIKEGYIAVLCKQDNSSIIQLFAQKGIEKEIHYYTDEELIQTLNFAVNEHAKNRKIVIWGTGVCCDEFEKQIKDMKLNISLSGYVDNNVEKIGMSRNGLPILCPKDINPKEFYVIIATDYKNYFSIEKDLVGLNYKREDYVHFRTVVDDVASYFKKVYRCQQWFDVQCINKDSSVRIKGNGDVCTCCMAYESIYGNLYENTFEEIWHSKRATISRLSLENKTYVYCDHERCPHLAYIKPHPIEEQQIEKSVYTIWESEYPNSVAPEVDRSCNLYCTSCRDCIFIENDPHIETYTELVLNKLVNLPTRFIINTVGEPFASKYSLKIIHDERTKKRGNISIYSNGTLLSPKVLDELLKEYETLELAISIDASCQKTYEKIRRNGNFLELCKNLDYMSKQKSQGKVTFFQINYVLQADNIKEMQEFIDWGKQLGVDRIAINPIEQWGVYTDEEFEKVSIFRNGEIKEEFLKYFTKEIMEDEKVNLFSCANRLGIQPKLMYMI